MMMTNRNSNQNSKRHLFIYMTALIQQFRANGHIRTAETYQATLNSFRKFRGESDIPLHKIHAEIIEAYEAFLNAASLSPNTVSFYMRILRATYNRAVEQELAKQTFPFRRVYTGNEKTRKRALPIAKLKQLKTIDISRHKSLDFARDMFMLSFYMRGMSFIDMAFLKKKDLSNGYITYRRRKTGQKLTIRWTGEMQRILDRYPENNSKYLLPIITQEYPYERSIYRNTSYNINRSLKKIAAMIGSNIPLTLYCARHSWATTAQTKGIPINIISEGMGHDSESTTRIYLAALDTSAVDHANEIIIGAI